MTWITRQLSRVGDGGGILAYHGVTRDDPPSPTMHVSAGRFREQLIFVKDRYRVIHLTELLSRIASGRTVRGVVALTFDDAYAGVDQFAAPVLRELDAPATVFVVVQSAVSPAPYWWDVVAAARPDQREDGWQRILRQAGLPSHVPHTEDGLRLLRDRVLARFCGRIALRSARAAILPEELQPLDFAGLANLATDERFDFGCHTLTHPALPLLPPSEQEREIRAGYSELADALPRVRPIVAFPYGLFDDRTIQAARQAGMSGALTMENRAPARSENVMAVPRVGVGEQSSVDSIAFRLSKAMRPFLLLRQRGPRPRLPLDPRLARGDAGD